MRTIKFRAWNAKHKYMDDTVFIRTCDGAVFDVPSVRFDTPNTEIELSNDLVIMQFTGLTDINGVEIYDGDIVKVNDCFTAEVKFYGCGFAVITKSIYANKDFDLTPIDAFEEIEVIGNIYQNPELLK